MRFSILIVLSLALISVSPYTIEDGIVVLTDDNFDQATLFDFEYSFVEFYTPSSSEGKFNDPDFVAAARQLAETNPEIRLCKFDASTGKNIAWRFVLEKHPNPYFLFFIKLSNGVFPYRGGRSTTEIIKWLRKRTGFTS